MTCPSVVSPLQVEFCVVGWWVFSTSLVSEVLFPTGHRAVGTLTMVVANWQPEVLAQSMHYPVSGLPDSQ